MPLKSQEALLQSEEQYKEEVYRTFEKMSDTAGESVKEFKADICSGAYEDQASFMVYGEYSAATKRRRAIETLVQKLYKRPYFAHIEAMEESESESKHYYLSDCESLDSVVRIGKNSFLLPFKQDKNRPISGALFHCYQAKKGEPIPYMGNGEKFVLIPKLICDDEIDSRLLLNAVQLFPEPEIIQITADELLEKKLQDNRDNPTLRNIISTLQRKQFEIIEVNADKSFVVQGCAGSGKSQCLLHRLFFLRDSLSSEGWNHVLILTPTQLFQNYSADLIRRYQLSGVKNCSIADLYRSLLNAYDVRFKNRQYQFELSEEYLPDEYLHEVYDSAAIELIDSEIRKAINKYVQDGCTALGIDMPAQVTAVQVADIVKRLDEGIRAFDCRENSLQDDEQYAENRQKYEELQNQLESLQKRREKLLNEYDRIIHKSEQLDELLRAVDEAEQERAEWAIQREANRNTAIKKLTELEAEWNAGDDIRAPAKYSQQLFIVQDLLYGEHCKADEEYARFLDEYYEQAKAELQKVVKKQTPEKTISGYEKRKEDILKKADLLASEIKILTAQAEKYGEWICNRLGNNDEGEKSGRILRRTEMERARYFLTRIESAVFEREVWKALTPLKEKYHVQNLLVENLQDGHQRETRILYKSDALFYLKIYAYLYPEAELPDYRLICIDEGQDLHKADYDMLHCLYPNAVFNVFGDTAQVIHTECGIHDWKSDTGIERQFLLNCNYRNTAAIVDFCNQTFGSSMDYIGKVMHSQQPHKVADLVQLKIAMAKSGIVMIVKDRKALEQLCVSVGKPVSDFEYIDTKAARKTSNKIPCYSIFAAKGLEFSIVAVYAQGMTINQKVVACTRAMEELYYYE